MRKNTKSKIMLGGSVAALVLTFGAVSIPTSTADAATACGQTNPIAGSGTPLSTSCDTAISATIQPFISLKGGNASIDFGTLTPTVSTPASKDVTGAAFTIGSNDPDGYTLTVKDATTSGVGSLIGQTPITANSIATGTGSGTAASTLGVNTWGISATSVNSSTAYANYQKVGTNAAAAQVATKSATAQAAGDTVTVKYGIKVDASQQAGTYKDTITYTLTAKS
jgi:hypothetical protein